MSACLTVCDRDRNIVVVVYFFILKCPFSLYKLNTYIYYYYYETYSKKTL